MNARTYVNPQDAMQSNLSFVTSQTTEIEAGVYRMRYPDIDYATLVPVVPTANPWTKSVTYFSMDGRGQADWINGNGHDIPTVGLEMAQSEVMVHTAGVGYTYGLEEVNYAAMAGISLPNEKAILARRAYEEFCQQVAFFGDTTKNFSGLLNHPDIPVVSAPSDGTGSSSLWANKTPAQKVRDVNLALSGVMTSSNFIEVADTLLLPMERYIELSTEQFQSALPTTTLEWLRTNNVYTAMTGQPLDIRPRRQMTTLGAGSTGRLVAYRRSPEVLRMHIPMPHMFLPVQVRVLQYIIPGIFRIGGVDVRLPKAARYVDGI